MNYKSWNDEELRRVLIADPDDTAAICEAAERFAKFGEADLEAEYESGYQDGRESALVVTECPHCGEDLE
jgi:hypothetical protein